MTISVLILVSVLVLIEPSFVWINAGQFFNLEEVILEPVFYSALLFLFSSLYLLLFNPIIQQSWWRWARFTLTIPIALIIILLPTYENGGGFISFGGTTDLVILWGVALGVATIIHTLYQRFYKKTGVQGK